MPTSKSTSARAAWRLGSIAGIHIRLHLSAIVIFVLISASLSGMLREWHPQWPLLLPGFYAGLAAVAFFASLLGHELAHSLTAKRRNLPVHQITLFMFGGVAEMEAEPATPKDEMLIAGAGPLASLIFACAFFLLAAGLAGSAVPQTADGGIDMSQLSGLTTVALWLAAINFLLALFNLLPGFPMDGGRLFRAVLWWHSGNYAWATRRAAGVGRGIGWLLVAWGFVLLFRGDLLNGIWTALIGWFIHYLASLSVTRVLVQQAMQGFDVSALMRTRFETLPADMPVKEFIDEHLLRSKQDIWPLQDQDRQAGYVRSADIDLQRHYNPECRLQDLALPLTPENSLAGEAKARKALDHALSQLSESRHSLPVVVQGNVVGLLDHADVLRWVARHTNPQAA